MADSSSLAQLDASDTSPTSNPILSDESISVPAKTLPLSCAWSSSGIRVATLLSCSPSVSADRPAEALVRSSCFAARTRRSWDRPTRIMRSMPSFRNRFAIANPIPEVPPVIMHVRPASLLQGRYWVLVSGLYEVYCRVRERSCREAGIISGLVRC